MTHDKNNKECPWNGPTQWPGYVPSRLYMCVCPQQPAKNILSNISKENLAKLLEMDKGGDITVFQQPAVEEESYGDNHIRAIKKHYKMCHERLDEEETKIIGEAKSQYELAGISIKTQQQAVEGWADVEREFDKKFLNTGDQIASIDGYREEIVSFFKERFASLITKAKEERDAHYKAILDKWTEDHVYDLKDAKKEERRAVVGELIKWASGEMFESPGEAGQFAMHTSGFNQALEEMIEHLKSLLPTGDNKQV